MNEMVLKGWLLLAHSKGVNYARELDNAYVEEHIRSDFKTWWKENRDSIMQCVYSEI